MEAWKLLDAAPFGPSAIEAIKQTFDEAWGSIAATIEPARVENTRLSLAHAIIAHAAVHGFDDLSALKTSALGVFRNGRQGLD
jgi:hypothetical protein